MAKKNAREEPPKPQVTENEQMSDIVFILDKMELILEAVSQIGKDGKFSTVAADKQHRNSFMKIDRYADAFENFIKNFWSQLKDPTRFGILSVKEDRLDDPAVQQAIEDSKDEKKDDTPADALLMRWTGNLSDFVEMVYGLDSLKCINGGETGVTELLLGFGKLFGLKLKDKQCYNAYADIKRRKSDSRTYFFDKAAEKLNRRMQEDEERERMRKR